MAILREGLTHLQCFEARWRVQVGILHCPSFIILQNNMCRIFSVSQQKIAIACRGGRAHHKDLMHISQVIYYDGPSTAFSVVYTRTATLKSHLWEQMKNTLRLLRYSPFNSHLDLCWRLLSFVASSPPPCSYVVCAASKEDLSARPLNDLSRHCFKCVWQ